MWYFKEVNENGDYKDRNGTVYVVTECYRVIAPDGRRNAELGYTEFENFDKCLEEWGLIKIERNT